MDGNLNFSLCFNKDEFSKPDFSVDKFVSECRKYASLEEMREDLSIYHKILCSAMIELINKDYADFVNLSSNLVGLDKSLKSLSTPLQNLKGEVNKIKCDLDATLQSAKDKFSEKIAIRESNVSLRHILRVLEGLDSIKNVSNLDDKSDALKLEILERVGSTFNEVQFHMSKVANFSSMKAKQDNINSVSHTIEQHLEKIFTKSIQNHDKYSLTKVLQVYAIIGKEDKVEKFFQIKFVKPFTNKTITQFNLTKHGLSKVFSDILNFISNFCSNILSITKESKTMPSEIVSGYDFLVNAVWPEIMDCFERIAPVYLNSPGNPQHFHENYTASIKFLEDFEQCCKVKSSVEKLRSSSSYKNFLKKWNLDLYFQIKFQEIASEFESSLIGSIYSVDTTKTYALNASLSLLHALSQCWSDDTYLSPLRSSFWRLTLQILARYQEWSYTSIKEDVAFSANLVKDVSSLSHDLKSFLHGNVFPLINDNSDAIRDAVNEIIISYSEIPNLASKSIVETLTSKCSVHLKQINDIPRLYRRTNREIPTKPSNYISLVFLPLEEFVNDTKSTFPLKWKEFCQLEVSNNILAQCFALMNDVLTSIKKMGESLKILKKRAKEKPTGQVTDDDKIKRQLSIDVEQLEEIVLKLGIHKDSLTNLKELRNLVATAQRTFDKS